MKRAEVLNHSRGGRVESAIEIERWRQRMRS